MNPPAPEQRELLLQARRASLMKVWATGSRRLSAEERREIADITHESAVPETPAPPPASVVPEATNADVARWMTTYSTSRRPLFTWIAVGRTKADPCPLDRPAEMPEWWARNMKHRVPAKILAAARSAAAAAPPPAVAEPPAPSTPAATEPLPADDLFATADLDFESQVRQMRSEQARIQRQLDEARRGKIVDGALFVDQPTVESLLRQRLAIQEPLRKAEGDLVPWLQQREKLWPADEVRAENTRIARAIGTAVLRLVRTVRPQLAGKTEAEQDRIWHTETLACFAALKTAKFTEVASDDLTP